MKYIVAFTLMIMVVGCKKAPSLEPKFSFLYGTWTTPIGDVEITLKTNGRMIVHNKAERGYDFNVNSTDIYTDPSGWTRINFIGREKKEPVRVEFYFWPDSQKIAVRVPYIEDSLTKYQ